MTELYIPAPTGRKEKKMFATGKRVLLLVLTGLLLTACGGQGGGGGAGGSVNIDNGPPAQPEKEAPRVIIVD